MSVWKDLTPPIKDMSYNDFCNRYAKLNNGEDPTVEVIFTHFGGRMAGYHAGMLARKGIKDDSMETRYGE